MIYIYTDGGSRGNHQHAQRRGYGSFVVVYKDEVRKREDFELGDVTNNEAECIAMIRALHYASELRARTKSKLMFCFRTDSQLLANQVKGWKIKAENLRPLITQIRQLLASLEAEIEWVPREEIVKIVGH